MAAHEFEFYRDIPRSCTCRWTWKTGPARWVLTKFSPHCVWHVRKAVPA